jgi:unsaturated pyranuronate lyase
VFCVIGFALLRVELKLHRKLVAHLRLQSEHSRERLSSLKILEMKRENPTIEICPGITRRTVANGETMYQMLATLAAGSRMPAHSHPQEQIVHILEGQMRLIVEGMPHELSTGDSFYLSSNVPHGVEVILPTRVLDTFSPPRDDYLAIDEKVRHGAL